MASTADPSDSDGPQLALLRDRRFMVLLIAGGVIALVTLTVVGFSGAYFTSTSRSPGNEFEAGEVGVELSVTGEVIDGDGMLPGDSRSGEQTVTNTGHRAVLSLEVLDLDPTSPLAAVLGVRVRQTLPAGADAAYDGPLADLGSVELGTLAKDESRTYSITVEWPEDEDDPALEGERTSLDFDWQLESVP
jgi:hypothetical protein